MNSSASFKRYAGSTILYQLIDDYGHLPFMQRNIRQVLSGHERELEILRARKARQVPPDCSDMRRRKATAFEVPDQELVEAAVRQSLPARLMILPRSLEQSGIDYASDQDATAREPNWLPPSDQIPVVFTVEFLAPAPNERRKVLLQENRHGSMTRRTDANGETRFAFVVDEPFLIDAEMLYASRETKKSGAGTERDSKLSADLLRFTVSFEQIQYTKDLDLELCGEQESPALESFELRTTWDKLPECPSNGSLIGGYSIRNGAKRRLQNWGFRIDIGWSNKSPTVLSLINQALSNEEKRPSSIKSSSETGLGRSSVIQNQPHYSITYVYTGSAGEIRSIIQSNLKCIFCDSKLPHLSFESLNFHYTTYHDHFSYFVSDGEQNTAEIIEKIIEVDLAEPQRERASNHVLDPREIHWVRPDQPFNLKQYLEGERSWVDGKSSKRGRRGFISETDTSPSEQDGVENSMSEDAPDLPTRPRKAFTIPRVPGVTFYRTHSKRPVEPGEVLEDSDDDIDTSWLQQQMAHRKTPYVSEAHRRFIVLYDAYMSVEAPRGLIYLPNAVLRFTRTHIQDLRQPDMLTAFREKLGQLESSGQIRPRTRIRCLAMLHENSNVSAVDGDGDVDMISGVEETVTRGGGGKGKETSGKRQSSSSALQANEDFDAAAALAPPPPMRNGSCVCGRACTTAKGIIFCANVHCSRSEFHLGCVGLERRVPGWRCSSCQSSVAASPATVAVV